MSERKSRTAVWAWIRGLGGLTVLGLLVWHVGTGPFLDGLRRVDGSALVVAAGIGALTTLCCAWRWRLVLSGLGVMLPWRDAVTAYYRSLFLNATLPGGVVGDAHRAVRHGMDIGDVGLGVRAVVLERVAGLSVQVFLAVAVLWVFPSPARSFLPTVTVVVAVTALAVVLVARLRWARRWLSAVRTDVRAGLLAGRTWLGVLAASSGVVLGSLATFLLAARTAGAVAPLAQLVPLTMLALLAMGLPVNVAGWGAREGAAAWAFGAAGLTAAQGVATAVTYGVLVLAATLPGAAVLIARWVSRRLDGNRHGDPVRAAAPALQQDGMRG
jgi:glycosyltransferase 2 family protein